MTTNAHWEESFGHWLVPVYRGNIVVAYARVDASDYNRIAQHRWSLTSHKYVSCSKTKTYLHRFIMRMEKGDRRHVDHRDHCSLNNTRANLRVLTASGNAENRPQWRESHGYRGVQKTRHGTWFAHGIKNRYRTGLGTFKTEPEAAMASALWRAQHMPYSPEAERTALDWPLIYMGPLAGL